MTTNEILTLVRKKILETSQEIVSDETLLIYANLVQEDIIKRAFPNNQIQSATVNFTSGVGSLPTYFGTLYGDPEYSNSFYPELSIDDFLKETLPQAVTIEGGTIKVLPSTTSTLNIKYYRTYPTITLSVNPSFDSFFHEPIVYGILTRAEEDLQDQELADYYGKKYEDMLNRKIATQSNYEEGNQRAGQMFAEQQLITDNSSFSSDPNRF